MKKQVLFIVLMLMPLMARAQTEINGIYYNLNSTDKVAEVTYSSETKYTGSIVIPETIAYGGVTYSVTSIGEGAFQYCSLTSVEIPNSVTSIGWYAFRGCSSLTSVTIPNSVTSIGGYAFRGCSSLTSVTIPNSVTSIGWYAFSDCSSLTSVTIGNSVTSIGGYAFDYCRGLTSVEIPNSVTSIGEDAFHGCSGLTSVTIPNSVTSIGDYAFRGCSSLISVTIPNSVTSIGRSAFSDCYRLNTIYCLNPIPPTCETIETFMCSDLDYVRDKYDVYTYATLHVPMGSEEIYSSAHDWRYFNKIKEDMEANGTVYYANLTVKQGTIGYTRQVIKAAETYTIFIGSLGDNKVNCVTFNGVDVTDKVVNGYYTTPEIKGESVLSISFETSMDVKSLKLNSVKVKGFNGEISVEKIDEPSDVFVYSVDGKIVSDIPSAFGSVNIQVPSEQLYIVKVGSRTYKVAL